MTDTSTEPRTVFEIEDLRALEVLIDPFHIRILNIVIKASHTVREIAEELELPVTRLYYHVNKLLEAGIIHVVETEKIGAMTRRRFRAVAKQYSPAKSLHELIHSNPRMAALTSALVLEAARVDAEAMLSSYRADPCSREAQGTLGRTFFAVAPERVEYWIGRMAEVIEEIEQESAELESGELYSFSFVLAPLVGPLRGGGA